MRADLHHLRRRGQPRAAGSSSESTSLLNRCCQTTPVFTTALSTIRPIQNVCLPEAQALRSDVPCVCLPSVWSRRNGQASPSASEQYLFWRPGRASASTVEAGAKPRAASDIHSVVVSSRFSALNPTRSPALLDPFQDRRRSRWAFYNPQDGFRMVCYRLGCGAPELPSEDRVRQPLSTTRRSHLPAACCRCFAHCRSWAAPRQRLRAVVSV